MNKIIFLLSLVLFALPINIFSFGFLNNDEFIFATSNSNPDINITLNSTLEELFVKKAVLEIDDISSEILLNETFPAGEEVFYSFSFLDFQVNNISQNNFIYFTLEVLGRNNRPITPAGDRTNFQIIIDQTPPFLISPNQDSFLQFSGDSQRVNFVFSEPIFSFRAFLNGNLVYVFTESSLNPVFNTEFEVDFDVSNLPQGGNEVVIEYVDFAGNSVTTTLNSIYQSEGLSINLLTRKEDPLLKYFFDKDNLDFFGNSIYSSENSFNFKFQTTKPATCYYTFNRAEFGFFDDFSDAIKIQIGTQDNLSHEFQVDFGTGDQRRFWLACRNNEFPSEIIYLNDELGFPNQLMFFRKYQGANLEFVSIYPTFNVSYSPIDVNVRTNEPAICDFSLNLDLSRKLFSSQNFTSHRSTGNDVNVGENQLFVSCFDRVGTTINRTNFFHLDLENGVTLFIDESNLFSALPSFTLRGVLSETADCRASLNQIFDVGEFDNLPQSTLNGFNVEFLISPLTPGNNDVFIYCKKDGSIFDFFTNVIYDSSGPLLSNLLLLKNGREVEYLLDQDSVEFRVNSSSIIPINRYVVKLIGQGGEEEIIFNSPNGVINRDLSNFTIFRIYAENILEQRSNQLEKPLLFDLEGPIVSLIPRGEARVEILCSDTVSGCFEVFYGLSEIQRDCRPRIDYENDTLEVEGFDYLCVRALDRAGHETQMSFNLIDILGGNSTVPGDNQTGGPGSGNIPDPFGNQTQGNQTQGNQTQEEPPQEQNQTQTNQTTPTPGDDFTPNEPIEEESNLGIIILSAILLIILGVSGGGYYAYKKGYLDDQLVKYGVIKKKPTSGGNYYNGLDQKTVYGTRKNGTKVEYDDHLKRLNEFIDETLNKKNDVFDNFDSSGKEIQTPTETLTNKPEDMVKDLSQADFDEFYASSNKKTVDNKVSLEEEIEEFEDFYKKKEEALQEELKDKDKKKKQNNKKK